MKLYDELQGREKKLSRDDWAHGSLLIMNELLRCSNIEGEVIGKGFKSLHRSACQLDLMKVFLLNLHGDFQDLVLFYTFVLH